MNDREMENQIKGMKKEIHKEVSMAVVNMHSLTKVISNGTGLLIYRAITGKQ
jgi:hypothetical protein